MRRIATTALLLLATCGVVLAGSAPADGEKTYRVELDNAFGLVSGSEVRIAGVTAGTVEDLDVNAAKRAVVTIKVSGPLSSFRESATCSSEPQSLIAEYFLDCQPGQRGPELPEDGLIPVRSEKYGDQTFTTVQNDLVQATMREPFRVRFGLILNEFGIALAGNPERLNQAIRRGAPALRALDEALATLARQNRVIRQLNVDSDVVIGRLTERRDDVVRFIQNANAAASASAARRAELSRNFELLPGFLAELQPTLARLGDLAEVQTPLLADLESASGELTRLTTAFPPFNEATRTSLESLGEAADTGRDALEQGRDEINALRASSPRAYTAADQIANFIVDLDNPARRVENDTRAEVDTGRQGPTGYTGLEGLLNYVYWQTLAINQFDQIGHLLHFILFEFEAGPCGHFNAHQTVPDHSGNPTTDPDERNRCVSWVGPSQPDINDPLNLPPYHPSVCPEGSDDLELCNPNPRRGRRVEEARTAGEAPAQAPQTREPDGEGGEPREPGTDGLVPELPEVPGVPDLDDTLNGILGLDGADRGALRDLSGGAGRNGDERATQDLLNFLFGT